MNEQEMINQLRDLADYNEESGYESDAELLRNIADNLDIRIGNGREVAQLRDIADHLQAEPNPIRDIVKLNEERYGLSFDMSKEIVKLEEELNEMKEAAKNNDLDEFLDGALDCCVIAIGSIRKAGYDPVLALNEVVKEISSRKQDPEQEKKWLKGNKESGEKWLKWKDQPKDTLYKADFSKAKLKG
jgi:hypothetical protein